MSNLNNRKTPIYVTSPLLPELKSVVSELTQIWDSKHITNHGPKHNKLEDSLKARLKVNNVSLFNNGTIALLVAIKALNLPSGSEVITTPFTFAATPHCLSWNGLVPVFCDIEPNTMTIDANKIESLITEKTSAILGVHVYGFPCDVIKIEAIAKKHNLKVIYDGAHVFSTEIDQRGIGDFGDVTMFSFHATKLFNTIEGGCLTYNSDSLKEKIYNLRNFGIISEEEVCDIGINGKLNEIQAAIGLLNLELIDEEKKKRSIIYDKYVNLLSNSPFIRIPKFTPGVTNSLQYFPIVVEQNRAISRDIIYDSLKLINIYSRKYFYPLCSNFSVYAHLDSANIDNLPIANDMVQKVLCLPLYGDLSLEVVDLICCEINKLTLSDVKY